MPKIKRVTVVAAVNIDLPQRINYPSPDGEWELVFHSPGEWHMGADGWKIKLFHRNGEVTSQHKDFLKIAAGKGFRWERSFYPWSFNSKSLAMVTWDKTPIHLYEVASKKDKQLGYQGHVYSAQWAPDIDRLLVTFPTEGVLVDQAGEQQALVGWEIEKGGIPKTYWMSTGKCFFLVGRQSADTRMSLMFYSGVDGTLIDTVDLDPIDLVPYRWEDYVGVPRDRLSLQWVDPPIQSVGSMLDTWNSDRFDRTSNTLFLAVSRPVSSPYREGSELLCRVEQRWVAVELDPG